jgi:signal transduction histidine kinase
MRMTGPANYRGTVRTSRLPGSVSPWWFDGLLAAALAALVVVGVWSGDAPDETFARKPLSTGLLLACPLALLWRRTAPLLAAAVIAGCLVMQAAATGVFANSAGLAASVVVALYSLGAYTRAPRALVGAVLIGVALEAKTWIAAEAVPDESPFVWAFWNLLILSVVALGMLARAARRASEQQRRLREQEAHREASEREAVAEERRRIARELHDVVSHNVSASILQAGAAEELVRTDPHRAEAVLQSIQSMGREALGEMRRMLGILRTEADDGTTTPQPHLSDLPALVERFTRSGLAVTLVTEGTERPVAPGVELSAYRIVQESLTNVVKHARARTAAVAVRFSEGFLEVEVTDDGSASDVGGGPGHGQIGMRERVGLLGGELTAAPRESGGYRVRARFPLPSQHGDSP